MLCVASLRDLWDSALANFCCVDGMLQTRLFGRGFWERGSQSRSAVRLDLSDLSVHVSTFQAVIAKKDSGSHVREMALPWKAVC
jgi:hypothetical protein